MAAAGSQTQTVTLTEVQQLASQQLHLVLRPPGQASRSPQAQSSGPMCAQAQACRPPQVQFTGPTRSTQAQPWGQPQAQRLQQEMQQVLQGGTQQLLQPQVQPDRTPDVAAAFA